MSFSSWLKIPLCLLALKYIVLIHWEGNVFWSYLSLFLPLKPPLLYLLSSYPNFLITYKFQFVLPLYCLYKDIYWRVVGLSTSETSSSSVRGRGSGTPSNSLLECCLVWSCAGLVQATTDAVYSWVQQCYHVQYTVSL